MPKAVDIRKGQVVEWDGQLWIVHDATHVAKGNKRSYMQMKFKNFPMGVTLKQLVRTIGLWQTLRFLKDRAGIGRHARMEAPTSKQAAQQFREHRQEMEQRLQADFLFGDTPSIADFAAYHTLWFKRAVAGQALQEGLPSLEAWYQRLSDFGHGEREEISQAQAFAAAREHSPRAIPDDHTTDSDIGRSVAISPSDYALDAVTGTLVGSSATRYIVARETAEFGTVHVHFPRSGFEITPQGDTGC